MYLESYKNKGKGTECNGEECKGTECKDRYPKAARTAGTIGADMRVEYRRRPCDAMVVPYNPWVTLFLAYD